MTETHARLPHEEARPLLQVEDLEVSFTTSTGSVTSVGGVSFSLSAGECLGVVGESGSGKSVTALSIMRLLSEPPARVKGAVWFDGHDLLQLSEKAMQQRRGRQIAMIFQDPMSALNPVLPVGRQVGEVLEQHLGLGRADARRRSIELLDLVGIPAAARRINDYPHQLSGGMRQRVMIAIAIACGPKLLIADEPTTALDVTVQAQILETLSQLQRDLGMAMIMITHDMGVVAAVADTVNVMYAGRVVERGGVDKVFYHPSHPYTQGLLRSIPRIDVPNAARLNAIGGAPPNPSSLPSGCPFRPRCGDAYERCMERPPLRLRSEERHHVACWLAGETPPHSNGFTGLTT